MAIRKATNKKYTRNQASKSSSSGSSSYSSAYQAGQKAVAGFNNSSSSSGGSSNNALAQQAVDKGYVKSVAEYNDAEARGRQGGVNSNARDAARQSSTGITPPAYKPTDPIDAGMVADNQDGALQLKAETGANIADFNAFTGSIGQTQANQTEAQLQQQQAEQDVMNAQAKRSKLSEAFNLPSMYEKLQKQQGIPGMTKQLQEANLQLTQMQSQYAMTNQELAQQTVPEAFVIGQQNELAKTASLKIGAQAAYVQALQGNLELANHYVDKMIDLQAKDYEMKYQTQTDNLNLALGFLDRADRVRAQEVQFDMDIKKADYSNMLDVKKSSMQNALLNGAGAGVIQAIASAQTSDEVYSAAGRYAVDPMAQAQLQTERLQQANIRSQINERISNNTVTVDTSGKVVLTQDESLKINKELVNADAYKSIQKSNDSLNFLTAFEKTFNKYGSTSAVFDPKKNREMAAEYNTAILNLKEFFNLGVLNGPDEKILRSVLPDPTSRSNTLRAISFGAYDPEAGTRAGLNNMKKQIETKIDSDFQSLSAQYGNYSVQSVTSMGDVGNKYIQQKLILNPEGFNITVNGTAGYVNPDGTVTIQ